MTDTIQIPLNKLTVSDDNVRKTATAEGIAEMAASIKAHGLLHNLVVKKDGKKYGIVDGSRRFKALLQLAEAGHISDNLPISCKVDDSDIDGKELSLAANTLREQMHPADEFEAFRDMADKGAATADIAARFGCDEAHVTKLLKLGRVSPVVLKAYRADELNLEEVMAFTLTDDHARQETILSEMSNHQGAREIRAALTTGDLPVTDKLVKYVTLKAYEAADGPMKRDLFVDFGNGGYVTDVTLLKKLAKEKLDRAAKPVIKEGWKWIEVMLDDSSHNLKRIYAEPAELTAAEQKKLDKLQAEFEKLERKWSKDHNDSDDEQTPRPKRLDELDDLIDEIEDRDGVWTPEQKAMAGAIVTIGHDGKIDIDRGLVKPEDMPAAKGKSKKAAAAKDGDAEDAGLSASLIEDLTAQKSAAISAALIGEPQLALAAVVHSIAATVFRNGSRADSSLQITAQKQYFSKVEGSKAHADIEKAAAAWEKKLPGDRAKLWAWCLKQKTPVLLDLLSCCAALTVDAIQKKIDSPESDRLQGAQAIAKELELDMAEWFTPTADNYFSRVGKDVINEAIADVKATPPGNTMKKAELARYAEQCTAGKNWLPKPLRPA